MAATSEKFQMPFLLNPVVLTTIANVDLLAILALAEVSSALGHFIHDQVITSSLFCQFLRKNQYLFHHNAEFGKLVPVEHISRLHRAFKSLQARYEEQFYNQIFPYLGPLLALTPFKTLENTPPFRQILVSPISTIMV